MKTQVIFSFDTEDYTTERTADAVVLWTRLLEEEGLTGHFCVVGELAEQFLKWGRTDVVRALEKHVLGFHTCLHSVHPLMAERCDTEDDTAAASELEALETKGLEQLRRTFGDKPVLFAVPPGMDIVHREIYICSGKGIPFYMGALINDAENTLIDYCGATHIPYTTVLEECFFETEHDMDRLMDDWSRCRRVVLSHHPTMTFKSEFWDRLNYDRKNISSFGSWIKAPDRSPEDTEAFLNWCRALIRRLKHDPRFTFTDLPHILEERNAHRAGPILPQTLLPLVEELRKDFSPLKSAAYCVSDIFYAAASFLQGKKCYVPGAVKGVLHPSHGVKSETVVPAEAVRQEAQKIAVRDFIPAEFTVNGQRIGAADMLFAMADVLTGKEQIRLTPRSQTVNIGELRKLSELRLQGSWLFSPDFKDRYVTDRLRLQGWTWRKYGI